MGKIATECAVCGDLVPQKPRGRRRIFCSAACRQRAFVRRKVNCKLAAEIAKNNEWYERLLHDYREQLRKQTSRNNGSRRN